MFRTVWRRVIFSLLSAGALSAHLPDARAQGGPAPIDSSGVSTAIHVKDREVERAIRAYAGMLSREPEGQEAWTGFVRLLKGDLTGAKEVFQGVLSRREAYAPVHYGLALASYRAGPGPGEPETFAQRTVQHAERAAALLPGFEGPHRLLGRLYLGTLKDYQRAVDAFVRVLELDPTMDPEVIRGLATAYIRTGALKGMYPNIVDSLLVSSREVDYLPIAAQACVDRGTLGIAEQCYGHFFSHLLHEERKLYQDISLITSGIERADYEKTKEDAAARREFLVRFWTRRDPDLTTRVNERQIEHYRRVWYARTNFSGAEKPWDRRGEVYIRYGPPDHRSCSWSLPSPMSAEVERVKERIAYDLYGEEMVGEISRGPVYPILVQGAPGMDYPAGPPVMDQGEPGIEPDPLLEQTPLSPQEQELQRNADLTTTQEVIIAQKWRLVGGSEDLSYVRWESWVYTGVAGGIEIVFTAERGGERFDYAPVPAPAATGTDEVRRIGRLMRHSPQMVMSRAVATMPEYFMPGGQKAFLNFFYDRAEFRGPNGKTRLEVYYGIPPRNLSRGRGQDTTLISAGYVTALLDSASGETWQESEEQVYRASGDLSGRQGDFIPNQLVLEVKPGIYELRVQVKDLVSGRSGIYRERLEVEDYGGGDLRISDLELGWMVSAQGQERFRKGDLFVLPMTSKTYRQGQNPFVYYEVYNLSRDSHGRSRFRLDYTVQSTPEKGEGFGRLLASVGRLFGGKGAPEVSISSEQVRQERDLREYFELNLQKVKTGVNRLTLRVTDLNSGQSVEKEVLFRYGE